MARFTCCSFAFLWLPSVFSLQSLEKSNAITKSISALSCTCTTIDFEDGTANGFEVVSGTLGQHDATTPDGLHDMSTGGGQCRGNYCIESYFSNNQNSNVGELKSQSFTLCGADDITWWHRYETGVGKPAEISIKDAATGATLVSTDDASMTVAGTHSSSWMKFTADQLHPYLGRVVTFNVADRCAGGWCAVLVDDITFCSSGAGVAAAGAAGGTGGAAGGAAAVGDPHLQNVHGERFDLMKAGTHVLINIPRGKSAEQALFRVQANARALGGQCADMYFQELNVTGSWAEATKAGGYHYSASQRDVEAPKWVAFGERFHQVELKVVHGRTDRGLAYLNVYVKHLGHAGFAVGGLLGEDDHEDVIVPPAACQNRMSLLEPGETDQKAPSVLSVAVASFA